MVIGAFFACAALVLLELRSEIKLKVRISPGTLGFSSRSLAEQSRNAWEWRHLAAIQRKIFVEQHTMKTHFFKEFDEIARFIWCI